MPLHWVVPCRRAVVNGAKITYRDALLDWVRELEDNRSALERWYFQDLADDAARERALDGAIQSVRAFIATLFADGSAASRAATVRETTTFDGRLYYARLWKGPLRVLLEDRAHRAAAATTGETSEPTATSGEHEPPTSVQTPEPAGVSPHPDSPHPDGYSTSSCGDASGEAGATAEPPSPSSGDVAPELTTIMFPARELAVMVLDGKRRALFTTTHFLPGDVIELPVFKLVWPAESQEFDPHGSFYLGTSVRMADGSAPPSNRRLHDNLVGTRFQLLMGALRGAFYSLEPTMSASTREPRASFGRGFDVHARGFLYAGSLQRGNLSSRGWVMFTNQWGTGALVPSEAGFGNLLGTILTPGGACTPTMGWLMCFMINRLSERWLIDGPYHDLLVRDQTSPLWGQVDVDLFRPLPRLGHDDAGRSRFRLVQALHDAMTHPAALDVRTAALDDEHVDRRGAHDEHVAPRAPQSPERRRRETPEEYQARLDAHQRAVDERAAAIERNRVRAAERAAAVERNRVRATERARRAAATDNAMDAAEADLAAQQQELVTYGYHRLGARAPGEAPTPTPPPTGHPRHVEDAPDDSGTIAWEHLQAYLEPINVIATMNHSFAVVRLSPASRLIVYSGHESGPPRHGFLTAYDPLSGEPFVIADPAATEPWREDRLYLFEAGGALHPLSGGDTTFGANSFRWAPIPDNAIPWTRRDHGPVSTLALGILPSDERQYTLGIVRLREEKLFDAVNDDRPLLPLVFGASTSDVPEATAEQYATRAVPFPTFAEAAALGGNAYPTLAAVETNAQARHIWEHDAERQAREDAEEARESAERARQRDAERAHQHELRERHDAREREAADHGGRHGGAPR